MILNKKQEFYLFCGLITIFFVWFLIPMIWSGSESIRVVAAFDSDEATHMKLIRRALVEGSFSLDYSVYGYLYFNIVLLFLKVVEQFIVIDDQVLIITLRVIPAIFSLASLYLLFSLIKRFFGATKAWISAGMFCIVPLVFVFYSWNAHPDNVQLFFIILSMYWCYDFAQRGTIKAMTIASIAAGLAFAAKYAGIFIVPIIVVIGIYNLIQQKNIDVRRGLNRRDLYRGGGISALYLVAWYITGVYLVNFLKQGQLEFQSEEGVLLGTLLKIFGMGLLVVGVGMWFAILIKRKNPASLNQLIGICGFVIAPIYLFLVGFYVGSPNSFIGLQFIKGLIIQSQHITTGHVFIDEMGGFDWIKILASRGFLGILLFVLSVAGSFRIMFRAMVKKREEGKGEEETRNVLLTAEVITLLWLILYLGYLIIRVRANIGHYLLPAIPFVMIIAISTLVDICSYLARGFSKKRSKVVMSLLLATGCLAIIYPSFQQVFAYRTKIFSRYEHSNTMIAGNWISKNYDKSITIMGDAYSYVPLQFTYFYTTWAMDDDLVKATAPDLIITTRVSNNRYSNLEDAMRFVDGEEIFIERYNFYSQLRNGGLPYKKSREFGDITVYEKEGSLPIATAIDSSYVQIYSNSNGMETAAKEGLWFGDVTRKKLDSYNGKWVSEMNNHNNYSVSFVNSFNKIRCVEGDIIRGSAWVRLSDTIDIDACLVLSFEDESGQIYKWNHSVLSKYVKVPDEWTYVFIETAPTEKIENGGVLKFYIWSPGGKRIFVDDMTLEVFRQ